jgi:hypothetical protein
MRYPGALPGNARGPGRNGTPAEAMVPYPVEEFETDAYRIRPLL